jgi:Big-like domain-containing protein
MKLLFLLVMIVFILFSCNDDVNVTLEKEPGTLFGRVMPLNINAGLELYQGTLLKTANADNDGYFTLSNLDPGGYILKIKADNYGRVERHISISDGEGYDMGTIELINLPFPISDIQPYDGATDVSNNFNSARIYVYTSKSVNVQAFKNAFSISPAVDDLTIAASSGRSYSTYFRIEGKFQFDQLYSFELDTTLVTQGGEQLEFPLTSTFTTEKFKVNSFDYYQSLDRAYFSVRIRLNGEIDETALNHVTVEPDIPIDIYLNRNYIEILPLLAWPCDTTVSITLQGALGDLSGSTLGADTTLNFNMSELEIIDTDPYNDQRFINTSQTISIIFNNVVDESTIENAISIVPPINYDLTTYLYSGQSRLYLYPDSLQSNTEYTVTLDTTLHGYYMGHLNEEYTFKFYTK